MKNIAALLLCILSFSLSAQHFTIQYSDKPINLNKQSVLLIPFQAKLYLSDVNRDLMIANDLTSKEVISRFTAGVDQSILFAFEKRCRVSSFYQIDQKDMDRDLAYIYRNVKLKYELVSKTKEKNNIKTIKFKKRSEEYQGGRIEDGQIKTTRDNRERYMKAIVTDNNMLDSMHYIFNNKFFLFINELDLKNQYADAIEMGRLNYNRELKLHYTIYNDDGEILSTGISKTTFPAKLNDINKIIKNYFPILAEQIYADLFRENEDTSKNPILRLKNGSN